MDPDNSETPADLEGPDEDPTGGVESDDHDDLAVDLDQRSETDDDVDLDVTIVGAPASVELDAEIDQQGELDQDADIASDEGDSHGGNIAILGAQRPEVDQRIEVDVEISEGDDGEIIIEVDVDIEDDVEIESDAEIDIDDDDGDAIVVDIEQDTETDGNVDVDVEIRDDLDAEVDVDVASILDALASGIAEIAEDEDGWEIYADFEEYAGADGDVDIFVDVGGVDA